MSKNKISKHIFSQNGGYLVYCSSNLFHNAHSFENWGLHVFSGIASFCWEIISHVMCLDQSPTSEKYLMDYKM